MKLVYRHLRLFSLLAVSMLSLVVYLATPARILAEEDPTGDSAYVVQAGETLWSIATQHGTTWPQVAELNGLANPDVIFPGQLLHIPTITVSNREASTLPTSTDRNEGGAVQTGSQGDHQIDSTTPYLVASTNDESTPEPAVLLLIPRAQYTDVLLAVRSDDPGPQPVHIHHGSCIQPEGVRYPLTPMIHGLSWTTLDTPFSELVSGHFALTLHLGAGREALQVPLCLNLDDSTLLSPQRRPENGEQPGEGS
jgi:hypothetical protein